MFTLEIEKQLKNSALCFQFPNTTIFKLSGKDATRYLHARCSQDIKNMKVANSLEALILNPQGKIQAKLEVFKGADNYILVSDPLAKEDKANLKNAIHQFKVADDIELEDLSTTYSIVSICGLNAQQVINKYFSLEKCLLITCKNIPIYDVLIRKERLEEIKINFCVTEIYNVIRIAEKISVMGIDLDEKITASEIDIEHLVSFNKGCYAGQEVVEMSTARGRPNKKLVLLKTASSDLFAPHTNLFFDQEDKPCGYITSGCSLETKNLSLYLAFIKTNYLEEKNFHIGGAIFEKIDSYNLLA